MEPPRHGSKTRASCRIGRAGKACPCPPEVWNSTIVTFCMAPSRPGVTSLEAPWSSSTGQPITCRSEGVLITSGGVCRFAERICAAHGWLAGASRCLYWPPIPSRVTPERAPRSVVTGSVPTLSIPETVCQIRLGHHRSQEGNHSLTI